MRMPVGLPARIANDFAARRIGRVLGVADRSQRGAVQKRPVIEVKNEDRRIGRGLVQLVERRHPALGELKFGPASDHSHPLSRRRPLRLFAQHAQAVGERRYAIPAKLQVVVEAAANQVKVRIVQPWNDGALVQVDELRLLVPEAHHFPVASDREELAVRESPPPLRRSGDRPGWRFCRYEESDRRLLCSCRASATYL